MTKINVSYFRDGRRSVLPPPTIYEVKEEGAQFKTVKGEKIEYALIFTRVGQAWG